MVRTLLAPSFPDRGKILSSCSTSLTYCPLDWCLNLPKACLSLKAEQRLDLSLFGSRKKPASLCLPFSHPVSMCCEVCGCVPISVLHPDTVWTKLDKQPLRIKETLTFKSGVNAWIIECVINSGVCVNAQEHIWAEQHVIGVYSFSMHAISGWTGWLYNIENMHKIGTYLSYNVRVLSSTSDKWSWVYN